MADNITILDSASVTKTVATKDFGSDVHGQKYIWVNEAGAFIAKAEDTAHVTGDPGVMALAVRNDALVALTGTDGDYSPIGVAADGSVWTKGYADKQEDDAHSSGAFGSLVFGVRKDTAVALAGTDGDYQPAIYDASGRLHVAVGNTPNVTVAGTPNVAVTSHVTQNVTLLASAARTVETTAAFTNEYHKGVLLILDVTVDPATADITPKLEVQDPITSTWNTYWTAAAAASAVGQFKYLIYPGAQETEPATITEAVNLPLPRTMRAKISVGDADSMTYSLAAVMLV